jgi:hypothetical protein
MLRLSVAALLAASCGGTQSRPERVDPADEIIMLSTQVQAWRRELGPSCDPVRAELLGFARPVDRFASCAADEDSCNLVEALCDNAEQICVLAGERGNDAWSNEKCVAAKRSCREARACIE